MNKLTIPTEKIKNYKEIYMIRHGRTKYNEIPMDDWTDCYPSDTPIDFVGEKQAKKTGKYLRNIAATSGKPYDVIYTSPYTRAFQTSDLIGKENNTTNIVNVDDIREPYTAGAKSDLKYLKIADDTYNETLAKIKNPIERYSLVNSDVFKHMFSKELLEKGVIVEEYDKVNDRVDNFIETIKKSPYDKMIVVTHLSILNFLTKNMFNINTIPYGKISDAGNCAISHVVYDKDADNFHLISPMNNEHLAEL